MITYNEALSHFLSQARPVAGTQTVPTLYAAGRVLAEPVQSSMNVPAWDNSQMDGYAVVASDLTQATPESPVTLPVTQRIAAGEVGQVVTVGTVARIFTGASIPEGATAVVPQENVTVNDDGTVSFSAPVAEGTYIRKKGSDVAEGAIVADVGETLTPARLGLIASVGVPYVTVYNPLKVGLFCSGSELLNPGDELKPGAIYNANRYTLRAMLKKLDCEVYDLGTVQDSLEATKEALQKAASKTDVILTSGGMSVGEEDHIKPAVEALGEINLWKVALKPGKPVALGTVCGKPFIGLPGNPVSTFVTFLMLARPFLLRCQGRKHVDLRPLLVRADFDWTKPGNRQEFVRVQRNADGGVTLYPTQNSQVLTSCAWADGLVNIPMNTTIAKGDLVYYYPFGELFL